MRRRLKKQLMLELAVLVAGVIVFLGVLNALAYTSRIDIITSEKIFDGTEVWMTFDYYNSTSGVNMLELVRYNFSDIATVSDGWIYLSIPYPSPPAGYDVVSLHYFDIRPAKENGEFWTWSELIGYGINHVELEIFFANSTTIYYRTVPLSPDRPLTIYLGAPRLPSGTEAYENGQPTIVVGEDTTWNSTVKQEDGLYYNYTSDVDPAALLITLTTKNWQSRIVTVSCYPWNIRNIDYVKVRFRVSVMSTKPMLQAFTEPLGAIASAIYTTLLAYWQRLKSYLAGALAGFGLGFLFTGLIGDAMLAFILVVVIATVWLVVFRPRRRRR